MVKNPFDPASTTISDSTPESNVAQPSPAVEQEPSVLTEEPETKTEVADAQALEQPENQFDDLDEDLTDLEESTDTVWLLRRVGVGIIKALLILGGLGIVGWLIWGGADTSEPLPRPDTTIEKLVEKPIDSVKEEVQMLTKKETEKNETSPEKQNSVTEAEITLAGRSLSTWNYWLESQRITSQKGVSADVLLWKREVEILFEIPFAQQINGENSISRNYQVGILLQRIDSLLLRESTLQERLVQDIAEFSSKAAQSKEESTRAEQEFLAALQDSNPVGISGILDEKIEAEKFLQQYAIEAEAREIFAQKISEYRVVLANLQTVLTANREAIVQNIQVVNFPLDPFNRVLAPDSWGIH